MASLAERHRVIAIDLPGHGESDKPEIDYTHDLFVRAVAAVMKDAGVKSAVLIGHSMGGTVARAFLRQNREMVRGLVLVDSPWIPDGGDAEQTKKRENALRSVAEMSKGPNGTAFRQNMVGTMFVKSTPPEVKEQVSKAMLAAPPYVASSAMLGIVAMMVWKPEPVRVPVMIVAAKQQGRGGDRAYLDAFIPELRYEEWEGVGHFLMMEQPERFNALVRSFLASVERR
jgi:pimeloyl-ACP methyl ester carboxylesterase